MMLLFLLLLFISKGYSEDTRIKIAVLDTGIDIKEPYHCEKGINLTKEPMKDQIGHGTNIAAIIGKKINSKTHCVYVIKIFGKGQRAWIHEGVQAAIAHKVKYINLSLSGLIPQEQERRMLKLALDRGIKISVSAGNDNYDLNKNCNVFPACYEFHNKNYFVVANYCIMSDNKGKYVGNSNLAEQLILLNAD